MHPPLRRAGALAVAACWGAVLDAREPAPEFSAPPPLPIPGEVRDLTEETRTKLEALAHTTVALLRDRDAFGLRKVADAEAFAAAVYAGLGLPAGTEAEMKKGVLQGFQAPSAGLLDPMLRSELSHVAFLRLGKDEDGVFARFRQSAVSWNYEYFDLHAVAAADGSLRWVDARNSSTWERRTASLRRNHHAWAASRGDLGPKAKARMTPVDKLFVEISPRAVPGESARDARRKVLDHFSRHLEVVERSRHFALMRIEGLALVGAPADHVAAIGRFMEVFPEDRAVPIQKMRADLASGRFEQALAAIDAVDQAYGPDPFLDAIRAAVKGKQERYEEGVALARKAIVSCPDAPLGHVLLMRFSSRLGDFATTEAEIKALIEVVGMNVTGSSLKEDPLMKNYLASPAGMKFLNRLPP